MLGVLLLLLCLPAAHPAQSGAISGRVTVPVPPARDGGPLPLSPAARAAASLGVPASGQDGAARVVLDGGARETYASSTDGSFVFEGVAPGVHLVEVFHRDLVFPTYRVRVPEPGAAPAADAVGVYPYPGSMRLDARLPLEAAPVALPQHFEDRPPSSLWGLARSPMVWMGGVMLLLMFMMKGMDPEEMKCVFSLPPSLTFAPWAGEPGNTQRSLAPSPRPLPLPLQETTRRPGKGLGLWRKVSCPCWAGCYWLGWGHWAHRFPPQAFLEFGCIAHYIAGKLFFPPAPSPSLPHKLCSRASAPARASELGAGRDCGMGIGPG